ERTPEVKVRILRRLGDTSLYVAGFFQEFFNRKTYDINYYIAMGQAAYTKVADLSARRSDVYDNLSEHFIQLVDLVAEISESQLANSSQRDLLGTYERWLHTNSSRLRRVLNEVGIDPVYIPKKIAQ